MTPEEAEDIVAQEIPKAANDNESIVPQRGTSAEEIKEYLKGVLGGDKTMQKAVEATAGTPQAAARADLEAAILKRDSTGESKDSPADNRIDTNAQSAVEGRAIAEDPEVEKAMASIKDEEVIEPVPQPAAPAASAAAPNMLTPEAVEAAAKSGAPLAPPPVPEIPKPREAVEVPKEEAPEIEAPKESEPALKKVEQKQEPVFEKEAEPKSEKEETPIVANDNENPKKEEAVPDRVRERVVPSGDVKEMLQERISELEEEMKRFESYKKALKEVEEAEKDEEEAHKKTEEIRAAAAKLLPKQEWAQKEIV